jgi:hypothetical protein
MREEAAEGLHAIEEATAQETEEDRGVMFICPFDVFRSMRSYRDAHHAISPHP